MMYTISTQSDQGFDETIEKVEEELSEQGFGVLADIDVQATMKEKLDADFHKYTILGACNPDLAHEALEEEISLGALLPCNVIVYEDSGKVFVEAADPEELLGITGNEDLDDIASRVKKRLEKVVSNI